MYISTDILTIAMMQARLLIKKMKDQGKKAIYTCKHSKGTLS